MNKKNQNSFIEEGKLGVGLKIATMTSIYHIQETIDLLRKKKNKSKKEKELLKKYDYLILKYGWKLPIKNLVKLLKVSFGRDKKNE